MSMAGEIKLMKLRSLICAREFNTAWANRDIAQMGQWTSDYAKRDAELDEAITALVNEPVADVVEPVKYTYASTQETECAVCRKLKHTPLKCSSMGGYVCLTCVAEVLDPIEPLDGACVRTLPTPQGGRRFLCLPECDLAKPAGPGRHLIRLRDCWDITPMATTNTMRLGNFLDAIYGPLEEVV